MDDADTVKTVTIGALDARIRLEAPGPIAEIFRDVLADVLVDDVAEGDAATEIVWSSADGGRWHIDLGPTGPMITDLGGGLAGSIIEINRRAASSVATSHTVLHAGAFEVRGRAIAVTGASGAGKSTLVAAAILRGHGYLADEVCAVDTSVGSVLPYHRPVGLRSLGARAIGLTIPVFDDDPFRIVYPWQVGRFGRLADASPLELVAFVRRRPGPTEVTPVSPADALVELTNLSLGTDGFERTMFRRLDRLVRDVRVVDVGYEDSFAAIDALADVV